MHHNILFLTLNTFSFTGGIEKVCRAFTRALYELEEKREIHAEIYSLHDLPHDRDSRYVPKGSFKGFSGKASKFMLAVLKAILETDTIVISHINLLFVAMAVKRLKPSLRIIMFAHGIEVWRPIPGWKKRFLQKDAEVWAVSHFTAQKLVELYGIPPQNIHILPNCLDPFLEIPENFDKPASLLKKYNLQVDQPVLFTLTRLASSEAYKGYDQVISTIPSLLKIYPNLQYFIAGKADKEEKVRIQKHIAGLKLENNVRLLGFLPYESITDHFLLSDIFVMPSRKEGFGIVFIEAAACGCKVIAGNQDGSPDALLNGELGTLVDPTNANEIEAAIVQNLTMPVMRNHAAEIQQRCLAAFNFQKYQENIHKLLIHA